MIGRGLHTLAVVGLLSAGCSFDASGGGGETSSAGTGSGEAGSTEAGSTATSDASTSDASTTDASTTDASTTDASTTDASTTDASTTDASTTDASTTDASTTDASTTGPSTTGDGDGDGDCNGPAPEVTMRVSDGAMVTPPMQISGNDPNEYAWSVVEGDGTVTFTWQQACAAEYFVWGAVWDQIPGVTDPDPDSYWFSVDEGSEIEWVYGCTTEGTEVGWSYQPVTIPDLGGGGSFCDNVTRVTMTVPPGEHSITLRNREFAIDPQTSAAVLRLLLTEDEMRVPNLMSD